ncbi:hypothetical protein RLOC_00004512 [Lonchura striata]|uniref:Uncharacterized protein n=1 Tax=Lonchura striata TaxID=40157 RepID=A0A218V888_9PASE|nr:hypothetical protein RLOC_00004512 [Lonchura striata domestica]
MPALAESGQLQAAASSDLSPGSRLWAGAPCRLAQDHAQGRCFL